MLVDFIGGIASGAAQVLIMMPFELVKMKIQEDSKSTPRYRGPIDCLLKIKAEEGIFAFYKGTLAPLIGFSALSGIQFGVNKFFQQIFDSYKTADNFLPIWCCLVSGAGAGLVTSLISCPIELSRIKIQIQEPDGPKYSGSVIAAVDIIRRYGLRGIYRGYFPTLLRELFGYMIYFTYYKKSMEKVNSKNKLELLQMSILHGGLAGTLLWALIYPFDRVKSRMQTDSMLNPKFNDFRLAWSSAMKDGLYKGYSVVLVRAFPVNAGGFVMYEVAKHLLAGRGDERRPDL